MPSFDIPLSGLNADSTALNTIANNLSNMSTTGFKAQTTNFSDLFYQQVGTTGSGDEIQQGTGVQVASNSTDFTGGSISSTGVATDAAINGTGFFVLDGGDGSQLYTRDGNFQTSSTGALESTEGQGVMGYAALNGVINTASGLTDLTIPIGQVMQPAATTSMSLTQNLDSESAVGTQTSGQVQVYDSLGKSYEATVTYTNLGDNKWSYAITLPDTLASAAPTAAAATTLAVNASTPAATPVPVAAATVAPTDTTISSTLPVGAITSASTSAALASNTPVTVTNTSTLTQGSDSTTTPGTTVDSYTFDPSGTVNQAGTSLTITEGANTVTLAPANPGETPAAYAGELNTALAGAGINDVTASGTGGVLSFTGPTASGFTVSGAVQQDLAQTTTNYNFVSSDGSVATVDPATNLTITALNASGASVTIPAPTVTSGETVSTYAGALQSALTSAGINDVTVTGSNTTGQLSIVGPSSMTINNPASVKQDFTGTSTTYSFGSYTDPTTNSTKLATVDPASTLTITGPTASGGTATTAVPTFTGSPETAADYATDLTTALSAAGITGVTVTGNAATGQLSIVGPTGMTINGAVTQDMTGTTNLYNFQNNATIDPGTNLTITGKTSSGTSATITAPTVTSGETVAEYAAALTSALSTAGIQNVTASATAGQLSIVGANMSMTGSVQQDLANTTFNYDFGSNATVNPATNLTITGVNASGASTTITAPTVTSGESVSEYATALNNALTAAGIVTGTDGVTVTANGGQLSILGPTATTAVAGTASQDLSASTTSYSFGSSGGVLATVDPSTNLTITGQTATGGTATITAPTIAANTTLAQYATALNNALAAAGIAGVTVTSNAAGQLNITGANITTAGNVVQDPVGSGNSSGTLTFNSSGNLVSPSGNVSNITFSGLTDNSAPMDMTWNLFGANGTGEVSQTAAASGQSSQVANGYTSGEYQSFTIGSDGIISATYSNGQSQNVGQIALATVNNYQGLADVGSTEYETTAASGAATVGAAGTAGLGSLEGSSLEASNVNISQEFSNLIVAQRAFEANAKSVTTFDTVTDETINMIH